MLASARRGIVYPNTTRSDSADVPRDFASMVAALEVDVIYGQGTLAARPVSTAGSPGIQGRIYYATDTLLHYWDTGTSWVTMGQTTPAAHAASHLAAGSDALAWGTIHSIGTLAARPAAAASNSGYRYFATDDRGGTEYQSTGSAWTQVSRPFNDEFSYVEFTAGVATAATTIGTAATVVSSAAVTYDGATPIIIEFFCPSWQNTNINGGLLLELFDGASDIGILNSGQNYTGGAIEPAILVRRRLTPSNASHTYTVKAYVQAGTGTVNAGAGGAATYMPGFIRIARAA